MNKDPKKVALDKAKAKEVFDITAKRVGVPSTKFDEWFGAMHDESAAQMYYDEVKKQYGDEVGDFDEFYGSLKKKELSGPWDGENFDIFADPPQEELADTQDTSEGLSEEKEVDGEDVLSFDEFRDKYGFKVDDEEYDTDAAYNTYLENPSEFDPKRLKDDLQLVDTPEGRKYISNDPETIKRENVEAYYKMFTPENKLQQKVMEEGDFTIDDLTSEIESLKSQLKTMPIPSRPVSFGDPGYTQEDENMRVKRDKLNKAIHVLQKARRIKFADENDNNIMMAKGVQDLMTGFAAADLRNLATAGANEMLEKRVIHMADKKARAGEKLTDEDQAVLRAYGTLQTIQSKDRSVMFNVGKGVVDMIPFMEQMIITGGVGNAASKFVTNAVGKKVGGRIAGSIVGSVAQAPSMPMMWSEFSRRRVGEYTPDGDPVPGTSESFGKALKNSWIVAASEVFSERIFSDVVRGGTKYAVKQGLKAGKKVKGKALKLAKWDGILEEYTEEFFNAYLQAALTGDQRLRDVWDTKEQLETFLIVSIVGSAGMVFSRKPNMDGSLSDEALRKKHLLGMNEKVVAEVDNLLNLDNIRETADNLTALIENNKLGDKDKKNIINYSMKMMSRKAKKAQEEGVEETPTETTPVAPEGTAQLVPEQQEGAKKSNKGVVLSVDQVLSDYNLDPGAVELIESSRENVTGMKVIDEGDGSIAVEVRYKDGTKQDAEFNLSKEPVQEEQVVTEPVQGEVIEPEKKEVPREEVKAAEEVVEEVDSRKKEIEARKAEIVEEIMNAEEPGTSGDLVKESKLLNEELDDINREEKAVAEGRYVRQPKEAEAKVTKSESTQEFFSDVVEGKSEKHKPHTPWSPMLEQTKEEQQVAKEYEKHNGSFDQYIATSIPAFKDVQIKVINAIKKVFGGAKSLMYDIGGSEGGFAKTVTSLTGGNVRSINLDPNSDMRKSHEKTPVEGSEFVEEAFGSGFESDGKWNKKHIPEEKADIVHESMAFQFMDNNREGHINEVADNYLKEDGLLITEEKVSPESQEQWEANEKKKDSDFKSKHYTPEQITGKSEEVLTGMAKNQVKRNDFVEALKKRFDHVEEYWDGGNFRGLVASNNRVKVDQFLEAVGNTDSQFSEKNIKPDSGKGQAKRTDIRDQSPAKPGYGETNKIVTKERAQELREKLKGKLGQLQSGLDPETMLMLAELGAHHIEAGARSFAEFSKAMVNEFGDSVKPHLTNLFNDANKKLGIQEPQKASKKKEGSKESKTSKTIRVGTKDVPIESASDAQIAGANLRERLGKLKYDPTTTSEILDEAVKFIENVGGIPNAHAQVTKGKVAAEDLPLMIAVAETLGSHYGAVLARGSKNDAEMDSVSKLLNEIQETYDKYLRPAGQALAFWRWMKVIEPKGIIQHYKNIVRRASKDIMSGGRLKEIADLKKTIDDLRTELGKQVSENNKIKKLIDNAANKRSETVYARKAREVSEKRKEIISSYSKEDLFGQASAILPITPKMMEMAVEVGATYVEQGYYSMADISVRIAQIVKDNFGEEIDVKSLETELKGSELVEMAEKERKARVGKKIKDDMSAKEAAEVIAGTAKPKQTRKPAPSQRDVVRKKIKDLIETHYTERDLDGLARSLVDDVGISEAQANEITKEVRTELDKLMKAELDKQFERTIKRKPKGEKKKRQGTIQKMVNAINSGVLTDDAYSEMFNEYFGLIEQTDQSKWNEVERLAKKINDVTGFGYLEVLALRDFSRAITELMPESVTERTLRQFIATYYANMLAGPTTHAINMLSAGANIAVMPMRDLVNISNWVKALSGDKSQRIAYNPIARSLAKVSAIVRGLKSGARLAWDTLRSGSAESKYHEDRVGTARQTEFERNRHLLSKSKKGDNLWNSIRRYLRASTGTLRYVGRALAGEDQGMRQVIYEMQIKDLIRRELALRGLQGKELRDEVSKYFNNRGVNEQEILNKWKSDIKTYESTGGSLTDNQKRIRLRQIVLETAFHDINPASEAQYQAELIAQDNLFTGDRYGTISRLARSMATFMNKSVGVKIPSMFFVPFTKVIGNVAEFALDHGPYGFVRTEFGGTLSRTGIFKSGGRPGRNAMLGDKGSDLYYEQIGRAYFGTVSMIGFALFGLAGDDDDKPGKLIITGGFVNQPDYAKGMDKNVMKKWSFGWRQSDGSVKWFPVKYIYFPQIAIPMGIVGAFNDRIRSQLAVDDEYQLRFSIAAHAVAEASGYITDMTFVEGISEIGKSSSEIFSIINSSELDDKQKDAAIETVMMRLMVDKVLGGAARVLPQNNNMIKQLMRIMDPDSYTKKDLKNIVDYHAGVVYLKKDALKNRDIFGEVVQTPPGDSQFNIITKKFGKDPKWNLMAEFDAIPSKIGARIVPGTGLPSRSLTAPEYDRLVRYAGEDFKRRMDDIVYKYKAGLIPGPKDKVKGDNKKVVTRMQKEIADAWKDSKKYARDMFQMEYMNSDDYIKELDAYFNEYK